MSAGLDKIDAKLDALTPGTVRWKVMKALRQFRASWIELGGLLNDVILGGDYKEWGYDNFEVYCARELGLKTPTAKKLIASYNYMRKFANDRLDELETHPDSVNPAAVPDYQTVDLLNKVRQRDDMDEQTVQDFHRRAFEGDDVDEKELRKDIRRVLSPRIVQDTDAMQEGAGRRQQELAGILRAARELRRRLATATCIPDGIKSDVEDALVQLEAVSMEA